jgi:hypothetical protein
MDRLSVVSNASEGILRRDTAKESVYVSLNQTAVMEGVSTKVTTAAEAKSGKTTSEMEISKINVEENKETGIEAEGGKSAVEMESNMAVEMKNNETAVETGNDKDSGKVQYDKFPQVNIPAISFSSLSEQLMTFLKTNPPTAPLSANATVNTAKDCATISGHSVTSECQAVVADSDITVSIVESEPRHEKTDTVQVPSFSDITSSDMLPAVCDLGVLSSQGVCTNSLVGKTVMTEVEAGLNNVKVKQEKPSGYGDTDMSVFAISVEDRLQEPGEVKMEPEVMP